MTLGAGEEQQSAELRDESADLGGRLRDGVADEVHDQRRMEAHRQALVLVEADRAHPRRLEVARLLGVEQGNDDAALGRVAKEVLAGSQGDGDRGGVVIGAGGGDDTVEFDSLGRVVRRWSQGVAVGGVPA